MTCSLQLDDKCLLKKYEYFKDLSSAIDSEETALSKYEHELERMINESLVNGQDLYTQKLFIAFMRTAFIKFATLNNNTAFVLLLFILRSDSTI